MSAYQENENHIDFMNEAWWKTPIASGDYTKRRAAVSYTMDDLIGRRDANKYKLVTSDPATTGAGAGDLIV